ncbi:MAG: acyl-CoA/acyl-ACP dehydrogenase [Luminiphilus sp.]|jgi:acyl-CoA dehydrogenase|nr:acyl-CoA/acyl-ACP dehydrogenase [Luminiphilus sp.]
MSLLQNVAISVSDEQGMLLDVARGFVRDQTPIAAVRAQLETEPGFDPAIWKAMVDMGWTGIALPDSVGGAGMGVGSAVPVFEAMGGGLLGTPLLATTLAGQLLWRAAGEGAADWLGRLCAGSVATVAILDAADWGGANTGVRLDGQGSLTGGKRFVADAGVADYFVVLASEEGAPVLALVERSAVQEGAISANVLIDLTKRAANVDFTGVMPAEVIRGESVSTALRDTLLLGALLTAAESTGAADRCLTSITEYLKTRKQFGKLIGSYQALKHPTVDIYVGMENARAFVYHGATVVGEGALSRDAEIACRMAKVAADDVIVFAGDRSVQFHGGFGFTWDCDSTLFIRRAQWAQQMYGGAIHHRKRLAKLLLDG